MVTQYLANISFISIVLDEAERLLEIDSVIEEDDDDDNDNSTQTTRLDAAEDDLVRNASRSAQTKTDNEEGMKCRLKNISIHVHD